MGRRRLTTHHSAVNKVNISLLTEAKPHRALTVVTDVAAQIKAAPALVWRVWCVTFGAAGRAVGPLRLQGNLLSCAVLCMLCFVR